MRQVQPRIDTVVGNDEVDAEGETALRIGEENNHASLRLTEKLNIRSGPASLMNRQEYQKRLLTFQASTYYAKPACLSPLFCARFGWQNADKDMLVCSACGSALAITLNSNLSASTFDKLCQAYRNRIVSCHAASCPFRLSSIEQLRHFDMSQENLDSIKEAKTNGRLTVPIYIGQVLPEESVRLMEHPTPSLILRANIKKIYNAIRSINNKLAWTETSAPSWRLPRLQIPSKIRQMNSNKELTKILECNDESMIALALLGWNPIPNAVLDELNPVLSLGCLCSLKILDIPLENGSPEDDDLRVTPTKRQRKCSSYLNPLEAHRHYSPYKVGFPERAGETNPMWKIMLQRLVNEIDDGNITTFTSTDDIRADDAISVLDKSVDNIRKILRAGIASRKINPII